MKKRILDYIKRNFGATAEINDGLIGSELITSHGNFNLI